LREVYARWRSTLKRLGIRYRKPYAARHSSVSWNLMIGRNPLFVAQQHGHGILNYALGVCGVDGRLVAGRCHGNPPGNAWPSDSDRKDAQHFSEHGTGCAGRH
jgi:hypothetical protein